MRNIIYGHQDNICKRLWSYVEYLRTDAKSDIGEMKSGKRLLLSAEALNAPFTSVFSEQSKQAANTITLHYQYIALPIQLWTKNHINLRAQIKKLIPSAHQLGRRAAEPFSTLVWTKQYLKKSFTYQ